MPPLRHANPLKRNLAPAVAWQWLAAGWRDLRVQPATSLAYGVAVFVVSATIVELLFAFGWGASREPARVPEDDPRALPGESLPPRGQLAGGAALVLAIAVIGAAIPVLLAWRVTRGPHALFAHAVSMVCAVALVSSGARVATLRGRWSRVEPPSRRLMRAAVPLAALTIVLVAGAVQLFSG